MSAFQAGKRRTIPELSIFLFTRGLWLVFLELTVINFGWYFDIQFRSPTLAVIWALGISMVVLAILVHLPRRIILIISLLLIFGHNLLDGIHYKGDVLWAILHDGGLFSYANGYHLVVVYPIIPWVAVMPLGYCMGALYDKGFNTARRRKILVVTGVSAIALFLVLDGMHAYGDPGTWKPYDTTAKTVMSFLNPRKYPPSLLFLCMTLGPSMIFLAVTERVRGPIVTFFSTFGRVPFFYYILHIYLIHLVAMVFAQLTGFGWRAMVLQDWLSEVPALRGYGFDLWVTYMVWALVILALYPVCRAFDAYKMRHRDRKWLSYL
jgi:uncharacterized membrane protein